MAYYDALVTEWATLTGTTAAKLAAVNSLTVVAPQRAVLAPSQILNACVATDLIGLTAANLALLQLLLTGSSVDVSAGTTVRAVFVQLFAGKATTLANLSALVAPYDKATVPWWQSVGGLSSPVSLNDLAAAGGLT